MDKAKHRGNVGTQKSLKDEVAEAVKNPGDTRPDSRVWVRDDGAVCFGDECVVVKPEPGSKNLSIEIDPSSCGSIAGEAIVGHLIKTIGAGGDTNFKVKSKLTDTQPVVTHTKYPGKPETTQVEHIPKPK